ncbi:MAG TPA: sigma-54 dependent transcriptional regulator [Pseudomonadota bacterium]|nr:sigma-54 dependent transcriptional regulator [Pseudomonadota bacterium]HNN53151.1 sigma-54 dependent transcriptional regulator [Pseudomonadota bacterium]
MSIRALLLDDDVDLLRFLQAELSDRGYDVTLAKSGDCALAKAKTDGPFDVALLDVRMPGPSGLDVCRALSSACPDLPVVLMTGFGDMEAAISALRAGAHDFLTKPFETEALDVVLRRAAEQSAKQREVERLRDFVSDGDGFAGILGDSPEIRRLSDIVQRISGSDASVLVTGESGSGKELVARAIHSLSRRSRGPFVAINCAAMPDHLLESELFGHERGAFTGARAARVGLLRRAHGGTLFLDEIGDMSLSLQPKLLRALQEKLIRPVGSDHEVSFDVRVLAATHRNLQQAVRKGEFRADLFFRLNVISISVPPLRERGDDILLLAHRFLQEFARRDGKPLDGFAPGVASQLLRYDWPGNVRELRNTIEGAVTMARGQKVTLDDLPGLFLQHPGSTETVIASTGELLPLSEVERRHVLAILDAVGGNKSEAARILGVDRKTLQARLQRYGRM